MIVKKILRTLLYQTVCATHTRLLFAAVTPGTFSKFELTEPVCNRLYLLHITSRMLTGQCVHIVFFAWKATASANAISLTMRALLELPKAIPCIVSMSGGENFTSRAPAGHTHGIVVVLDSKESLATYAAHPAHQAVLKNLIPEVVESTFAMDYVVA